MLQLEARSRTPRTLAARNVCDQEEKGCLKFEHKNSYSKNTQVRYGEFYQN